MTMIMDYKVHDLVKGWDMLGVGVLEQFLALNDELRCLTKDDPTDYTASRDVVHIDTARNELPKKILPACQSPLIRLSIYHIDLPRRIGPNTRKMNGENVDNENSQLLLFRFICIPQGHRGVVEGSEVHSASRPRYGPRGTESGFVLRPYGGLQFSGPLV